MNIEVAVHERMAESGSSLLRIMQNNSMPVLDLFVRESIQNSLDASVRKDGHVTVKFETGHFESRDLNRHFDKVEEKLNENNPPGKYKYVSVTDMNTSGLTGPLHFDDVENYDYGNLLKLIYEISMPQTKEGAGGSWGLGKTVYFRLGIGIVIYYSRIRNSEGKYESRLAASMVEDQTSDKSVIPSVGKLKRGIAWWGKSCGKNKTIPLTDISEIREILKVFNLKEFNGAETGTKIIIPYIDEKKILSELNPCEDNNGHGLICYKHSWTESIESYLEMSVQKWYAPRLFNEGYNYGPYLRAEVNGKQLHGANMMPFFRIVQSLYIGKSRGSLKIESEDISIRNVLDNTCAGTISYVKLKREDLHMNPPDNMPSPYDLINTSSSDNDMNSPIMIYTRRPGMIVDYETTGNWADGIPKTKQDEFIVALFRLNSENRLKESFEDISLEEYIRKSEKADHTSWADWTVNGKNVNIVTKIQKNSREKIKKAFQEKEIKPDNPKPNIGLGKLLADILLPPENFGKGSSLPGRGSGGSGGGVASFKSRISVTDTPLYTESEAILSYDIKFAEKEKNNTLELKLHFENGKNINAESWESDMGKPYELMINKFTVDSVKYRNKRKYTEIEEVVISPSNQTEKIDGTELEVIMSNKFRVFHGVKITHERNDIASMNGKIYININNEVKGILTLE